MSRRGRKAPALASPLSARILEEHGGGIELRDASEKVPGARGAWMQLRFATEPIELAAATPAPVGATV